MSEKSQDRKAFLASSTSSTGSMPDIYDFALEGLSLYEMNREPRHPVADSTTTTLPIRILNKDLSCPICLNIIHNTLTVMECLHRFCNSCMNKSLRLGKKECPTCRVPCSSRRNMRPDPNFDALIKVLYPNLEQYEQQEESFIQQINNEYAAKGMHQSVEIGMKRQQQAAKRNRDKSSSDYVPKEKKKEKKKEPKPKKLKTENTPPSASPVSRTITTVVSAPVLTPPPTQPRQTVPPPPEDVSLAIAPYPGEKILPFLPRPFLRLSAAASVRHINKFLAMKFPNVDAASIKVVLGAGVSESVKFAKNEAGVVVNLDDLAVVKRENRALTDDVSLRTLKKAWNRREEILLLYFFQPKDPAADSSNKQADTKISIMTMTVQ